MRVDREVRHLPDVVVLAERLEALLDRVLVRARERGVDQVAHVGVARVDGQAVAVLGDAPGLGVDIDQDALRRLHEQFLECGIRSRNDAAQMRKYQPDWSGRVPRF